MSLYRAMRALLVAPEGPLENLYLYRLPPEQTADVDVAHIPQGGSGSERYLGSAPVVNGVPGVTHDGGVLWHRTAVQFQVRGEDPADPSQVAAVADSIRDVLIQFVGASVTEGGEEIVLCDLTSAPAYFGQDEQERLVASLMVEVWHRPEPRP